MELNGFYIHSLHILIPQNTESGKPKLNIFGDKYQNKNEIILYKNIINEILNQISDIMQEIPPLLQDS